MALVSCRLPTPLGEMLAVASARGLCLLEFVGQQRVERELAQVEAARGGPAKEGASAITGQLAVELAESTQKPDRPEQRQRNAAILAELQQMQGQLRYDVAPANLPAAPGRAQ